MGRNILSRFPNLCENNVTEDKRLKYCSHLHNLVEDMHIRFADLINVTVTHRVIQPFFADPADLKVELQDQFIDLQNDDESKINFTEDRYDIRGILVQGIWQIPAHMERSKTMDSFISDILFGRKRVFSHDAIAIKTKKLPFHQQTG